MEQPPATIDDYIASFPVAVRDALAEVLTRVRRAAPGAQEAIRYGMPAFRLANGHPVYFAGWKRHLSLHDIPELDPELQAALAPYRSGKDTLKFPFRDPVPYDLIEQVVAAVHARP